MAKKSAAKLSSKAQALLDAQVEWWLERLDSKALAPWLETEIDALLVDASKLKLEEVVSRADVQAVARRYAAELEPHGAIPELVGEIAQAVQAHPIQKKTKLAELMPDKQFREWLDKILELHAARDAIIHSALSNPVVSAVAGDLLYRGISGYLGQSNLTKSIPGATSMLKFGKSMLAKATPKLDAAIEGTLRKYIQQSLDATLRESEHSLKTLLTDDLLRDSALEIWASLKGMTVAEVRATVSIDDVEELFVIGYEHWRSVRKTTYYSAMIDAGVASFYDKYGKSPLTTLLDEMGITREMILTDLLRFGTPALATLKKKKLLDPLIRRLLQPFFACEAATKLLAD